MGQVRVGLDEVLDALVAGPPAPLPDVIIQMVNHDRFFCRRVQNMALDGFPFQPQGGPVAVFPSQDDEVKVPQLPRPAIDLDPKVIRVGLGIPDQRIGAVGVDPYGVQKTPGFHVFAQFFYLLFRNGRPGVIRVGVDVFEGDILGTGKHFRQGGQ